MSNWKKDDATCPRGQSEDLYVVELDERLEFGAAIIDSDLQADDNTGCNNTSNCTKPNNFGCHNGSGC
jgi:hypothetical protein